MASIMTGIQLADNFTVPFMRVINAVNLAVSSMEGMSQVMDSGIDTSSIEGAREQLNQATIAAQELRRAMESMDRTPRGNQPVPQTPAWTNQSNIQVFNDTGIQRLTNEMDSLASLSDEVFRSQQRIDSQALDMDILPQNASWDINAVSQRINGLYQQLGNLQGQDISLIGNDNAEQASSQFERIREDMNSIINLQARIEQAAGEGNVTGLNEGYNQLNSIIEQVERRARSVQQAMDNLSGIQWHSGTEAPVIETSGMERFQQETQRTNQMLETLENRQQQIRQAASGMDIFPPEAIQDINSAGLRLQNIRNRIQQIENNPLDMGADRVNNELEQLRSQLARAAAEQENMDRAIRNLDLSAANQAYLRLSQTIGNTERYIRDNIDGQERFNREIEQGTGKAGSLAASIGRAVAAYATIGTVKGILNTSDGLVQNVSRINLMNDGLQTTQDLVNMVYVAAQDSRGSFNDMAGVVARFGNNAKDAFGSSAEVVQFAGLVQKQMTIAGASTQEAANAQLQLSQALGSGVLRGDELNSIFEQAPNLIQNIADYLNVPIGKIREMAADGELSADIVKNAVFAATDEINENFNSMPMTWGQIWTSIKNTALMAFQPVLDKLNDIANSEAFQTFIDNVVNGLAVFAGYTLQGFGLMAQAGAFISDNWSLIGPVVYGIAAALIAFAVIMGTVKAVTALASAAQFIFNAALAASPLTWIIAVIAVLIGVVIALANHFSGAGHVAQTTFGAICGGVNVVLQFFKNLGLSVANIALGIWNALGACAENIQTAFHNAICNVQSFFYSLLSAALTVIEGICEALNRLPFVEFDYSGISQAADSYAARSKEAAGNKKDYTSIGDAFKKGINTYDTFQAGWASDAYKNGASWGDGLTDKVKKMFSSNAIKIPSQNDYPNALADSNNLSLTAANTGDMAKNTSKITDSVSVTSEELKYLRDMAERDYINRFTTAKITVNQTNHNTVKNDMDLDGMVDYLGNTIEEQMYSVAEGVH